MAKGRMNRVLLRLMLRAGVGFLAVIALLVLIAAWSAFEKQRIAGAEYRATKAEHAELLSREAELTASVKALQTPRGVEATIRERYPVVRPGEEVITIVSARPDAATTSATQGGIWDSIKNWLGW